MGTSTNPWKFLHNFLFLGKDNIWKSDKNGIQWSPGGNYFLQSLFSDQWRKRWVTTGFGMKVMLGGSFFVSGHFTFQISCEILSKIAHDQSAWNCCCSSLIHLPLVDTLDELAEILEGWRYLECHCHHSITWQLCWSDVTVPKENYCPRYNWYPILNQIRALPHQETWCLLKFSIRLFWLLNNLSCWVDSNSEMRS